MIIPIQCFSCGKQIAHKWEKYQHAQTLLNLRNVNVDTSRVFLGQGGQTQEASTC